MRITKTKILSQLQTEQINALWDNEFPAKLNGRFPLLLNDATSFDHYIIEDDAQNIKAWAVIFEKDQQIRFSLIVAENQQRNGLGGLLIERLKTDYQEFYGWVIDHNDDLKTNGEHYLSPLPFYLKHGFEILNDQRIDSPMIKAVLIKWAS